MRTTGPSGRFWAGDSLRAVAALGVIVTHVIATGAELAPDWGTFQSQERAVGPALTHLGNACGGGVYLFFVLSGYLVGGPFVRAFVLGSRAPRADDYLRNRLVRIVPLFWVVATVTLLVAGHRPLVAHPTPRNFSTFDVVAILGFFQEVHPSSAAWPFGHIWTLDAEMVFYIVLPLLGVAGWLVGRRLTQRGRVALTLMMLGCAWVGSAVVRSHTTALYGWLGFESFACTVWAFVPGMLLALLETTRVPMRMAGGALRRLPTALGLVGVACVVLCTLDAGEALLVQRSVVTTLLLTLAAGALVGAPLALQWGQARTWRPLDSRFAHWLGQRSYGLYLMHVPVLFVIAPPVARLTHSTALRLVILMTGTLVLTPALAHVGHVLVERPFLRLRATPYGRARPAAGAPGASTPLPSTTG